MLTFALFSLLLCLVPAALTAPQDMATQALLVAGQVKDVIESGAAARDSKNIEFMGAKASNNFEMGFGDAVRQRRDADNELADPMLHAHSKRDAEPILVYRRPTSDSDSSSDSSEERVKRQASPDSSEESSENHRHKRAPESMPILIATTDDDDSE